MTADDNPPTDISALAIVSVADHEHDSTSPNRLRAIGTRYTRIGQSRDFPASAEQARLILSAEQDDLTNTEPSLWPTAIRSIRSELSGSKSAKDLLVSGNVNTIVNILRLKAEESQLREIKRKRRDGTLANVSDDINKIVNIVNRFMSVGSTMTNFDPVDVAIPWAIVQAILQLISNVTGASSAVYKDLLVIVRLIHRYSNVERQHVLFAPVKHEGLEKGIIRLYHAILRHLVYTYDYLDANLFSRTLKNAIGVNEGVSEQQLAKILRAEEELNRVMAELNLTLTTDIRDITTETRDMTVESKNMITDYINSQQALSTSETAKRAKEAQLDQLKSWLKPIDTTDTREKARKARQPGTSTWILSRDNYYRWSDTPSPKNKKPNILWIHGGPGFGKTVICTNILDSLHSQASDNQGTIVYFYCASERKERLDPVVILRSWLYQLILADEQIQKTAFEHCTTSIMESSSEENLWQLFQIIASKFRCTLIVDGLDECDEKVFRHDIHNDSRSRFLHLLLDNIKHTTTHVLIASRGYDSIKSVLYQYRNTSDIFLYEVPLTKEDTQKDVLTYAKAILARKLPEISEETRENLAQDCLQKSEGMFLYVNLLGRGMRLGDTVSSVQQVIDEMPLDLMAVYEEELKRILDSSSRKPAIMIFRWLLFASRPLTLCELAEALIISQSDSEKYPLQALPSTWEDGYINSDWVDATLFRHCGSLIELHKAKDDDPISSETVHFSHASIREFLLKTLHASSDLSSDQDSNANDLVLLCLRYFCYDVFDGRNKFKPSRFPFMFYAASSWHERLKTQTPIPPAIQGGLKRLLDPEKQNWKFWSKVFEGEIRIDAKDIDAEDAPTEIKPSSSNEPTGDSLQSLSAVHLPESDVDSLDETDSESGADLESVSIPVRSAASPGPSGPMYYAALLGLTDLVKDFKARGLKCEGATGEWGTPLQAAIVGGHKDIVSFLLEAGVDVNTVAGYYGTAISAASFNGDLATVKQLLSKGADPDLLNEAGVSALHFACAKGHADVVKLLLERSKLMINVKPADDYSPIALAVASGRLDLVRILHQNGADLHSLSQYDQPLLNVAIEYHYPEIAGFLVRHHVDIEARDLNQATALLCACRNGDFRIFRLLMKHNADVEAKSVYDNGILHNALAGTSMDIVKFIIESGVDLEQSTKYGVAPIHVAAWGPPENMRLLLEKGVDINRMTPDMCTALMLACRGKRPETAKLLVEHGADLSPVGLFQDVAFDFALELNNKDLIEAMLAKGSLQDIGLLPSTETGTTTSAEGSISPLIIYRSIVSATEQDLLFKIDEEIAAGKLSQLDKNVALLIATCFESDVLVRGLLGRGAETCYKGLGGRTPLHLAARRDGSFCRGGSPSFGRRKQSNIL